MRNTRLGYVTVAERGGADAILAAVAARLTPHKTLCGVVQINTDYHPDRPCHMDLAVLGTDRVIRISQYLGAGSKGCRLDAAGLESAVGLVASALQRGTPDLLILNKFGKHEAAGRGFTPLIGQALGAGVPVLTAVSALNLSAFLAFAGGIAQEVPPHPDAVIDWLDA